MSDNRVDLLAHLQPGFHQSHAFFTVPVAGLGVENLDVGILGEDVVDAVIALDSRRVAGGAFENNDVKKASLVEPLEEVIDDLNTCVKANHIKRLQKGKCTIEQGFVLSDISTNLERVSDHCSNIAISVIEIDRDGFDAHGYLENLKRDDDPRFQGMVESYRKKYTLPA